MDAALRRAGRFDREIMLGVPDEAARARILAVQAKKLRCVLYTGSHTTALAW
jgi:ribosome biogenesis ATPase